MANTREDWLKERLKGIGGSEASAIIGLNPYMTNVELWELKTNRRVAKDISNKPFVKYGTEAEEFYRELFKLDYPEFEVSHEEFVTIEHPKHSFLRASLDGTLVEKETGRLGILEIKTTNILQSMQREKWNDRIPDNYFVQVLHYLMVTGYDFAILKAALKSEWNGEVRTTIRHYKIERAEVEADIEYLKTEEIKFWELVKSDTKPNLLLPSI
jgi:putative phage-type endonuclease